jgi:hypothetical protein
MALLACNVAVLAVLVIYLFWRDYLQSQTRRQRRLQERVAYLLWVLADVGEDCDSDDLYTLDNRLNVI